MSIFLDLVLKFKIISLLFSTQVRLNPFFNNRYIACAPVPDPNSSIFLIYFFLILIFEKYNLPQTDNFYFYKLNYNTLSKIF